MLLLLKYVLYITKNHVYFLQHKLVLMQQISSCRTNKPSGNREISHLYGADVLQASFLEVSVVASAWRKCEFNQQQETYPGGRHDCCRLSYPLAWYDSLDKFLVG